MWRRRDGASRGRPIVATAAVLWAACLGGGCREPGPRGLEPRVPQWERPATAGAQGPLSVTFASPKGATLAPADISVGFSKPMVTLARAGTADTTAVFRIEPAVEGEFRWLGTQVATFVPESPLPLSTLFRATVPAGTKAVDGSELAESYEWEFETPRLKVARHDPRNGDLGQGPDSPVDLWFNQPVAPEELVRHATFSVRTGDGAETTVGARARLGYERGMGEPEPGVLPPADPGEPDPRHLIVEPASPLPLDAAVTFTISGDLRGVQGNLPMGEDWHLYYRTYGPFEVEEVRCLGTPCHPGYGFAILFSNPVRWSDVAAHLEIAPEVTLPEPPEWVEAEQTHSFDVSGKLAPETVYRVRITPGLRDRFGQSLVGRDEFEVRVGSYRPQASLDLDGTVLEAHGPHSIPVRVRNVDQISVKLRELGVDDVLDHIYRRYTTDAFTASGECAPSTAGQRCDRGGRATERTVRPGAPRNVEKLVPLDLDPGFRGNKRGVLAVRLAWTNEHDRERIDTRIVRVTDLGVTAKASPRGLLVWVTSIRTGRPIAGARVAAYGSYCGESASAFWEGRTGEDGLVLVPGTNLARCCAVGYPTQFVIWVEKSEDRTYIVTGESWRLHPWNFGAAYSWRDAPEPMAGVMFTDRGIYRPGDTVHVKGIVRILTDGGLATPKDREVAVSGWDARGEPLDTEAVGDVRTGPFGSFSFDLRTEPDDPLGYYQLQVEVAGAGRADDRQVWASFRVAEYKAPTFAVRAKMDREEYVRGETAKFDVTAEYLFGAPMAGADVRWWVTQETTWFHPESDDWRGFHFGAEIPWWEEPAAAPDAGTLAEGSGKLSGEGGARGEVALAIESMLRPARVTIEGEVTDLDRSTVAARAAAVVHPGEFYVGVRRRDEGLLHAGDTLVVDVVALRPDETTRSGVAVAGTLYRRQWHTVRQEGMGGHYDYVSRPEDTPVGACAVVTADVPVACSVGIEKAGGYVLKMTARDDRDNPIETAYELWVAGADVVGWYRSDDDQIELVPDKEEYRPGDVAKILVQSPFPEAEMLVTVERTGVSYSRTEHVTGSAPVVEIPILESYRPNVYVVVALVRGRTRGAPNPSGDDPGKPVFRMGMAKLAVETKTKRLAVDVTSDAEEYAPGAEIEVAIRTRGPDGAGVPAEVTLFAVDEAVLQLTGYEPPDPMRTFWRDWPVSVHTDDLRPHLVSRRSYDEDKGEEGGGGAGGGDGAMRRDFRIVAYWNPGIITDADGTASVRFGLPEKLTTYRIMAVAASEVDRFGVGKAAVRIAKPLLIRPALPRFVRIGDRFEAGVVVTNRAGPAGDAHVTADVEGVLLRGDAGRVVHLERGESREVRFPFESGPPGAATLRFRVSMGDLSDGIEVALPVVLPAIPETVAAYGETLARSVERLGDLDTIRPDVGGMTVTVSSSALVGLQGAVDYLVDYPYGCAEQLVSRIVPIVAVRELCEGLGLQLPENHEKIVRGAIADLATMQRWDGGFGYWPDSFKSNPWLTAYVAWGLRRAIERGYHVPDSVMERALSYLHGVLRQADEYPAVVNLGPTTKAFVVYVLADAGEPETGYQEWVYERREALPLFAKGFLARAYVLSSDECAAGDCVQIVELRRDIENHVFQAAEEAHFEENVGDLYRVLMQSDVTTNAILLDTLLYIDVDHPLATKVLRWLLEERDGGHWATTQDSAHALLALAHYYRVRESEEPDFTATVDFGSERLVAEEFHGRPAREVSTEIPMARVVEGRGQDVLVQRQGPSGRLYYALSLHYARSDLPRDAIDRGFYLERHYEKVDLGAMREGTGIERRRESITRVRAGDLVRVQISVVVPQERSMVVIEDPLPGGLESLDFDLRTTTLALRRAAAGYGIGDNDPYGGYDVDGGAPYDFGDYGYGDGDEEWENAWWWTPFYHREDRDDRVLLFADALRAGVHHYEYLARAVTPGTFVVGPLRAEEMYNPETFGRTGVVEFVVDPPESE